MAVIRAHKGLARFHITVKGVAAHSAKPYLGINAISKMTRLIRAIEDEIAPAYDSMTHPLTGSPTLNIGVISGGVQVNFVPDECTVDIDRRVIPGETPEEALVPFQERLARAQAADPDLDVTMETPYLMDNPMETPEDSHIVQVAVAACESKIGKSEITGVPYGTDASKFTSVGIPAIVFGPGSIDQAHAAVEWS